VSRILSAIYFDLDQTLYEPDCGLLPAGDRLITRHLARQTGLPEAEADALRLRLWREYGTTARGAEIELGMAQEEFYRCSLQDLQPAAYLQPEPELAAMLLSLPVACYVVTNAHASYAHEVLAALGLDHCFAGVFDIEAFGWRPKPDPAAYEHVLQATGHPAAETAMVDDFAHNLPPAAALGMLTIYLGSGLVEADLCLPRLQDLPLALQRHGVTFRPSGATT
jgi:putative hydrolase of the HAD superfamily